MRTDGEYRRNIFWNPVISALDGLSTDASSPVVLGGSATEDDDLGLPTVTGKRALRDSLLRHETRSLLERTGKPTKATMPAMARERAMDARDAQGSYPTRKEYVADLVQLMREEIATLAEMDVDYVQLDSPRYTYACSEEGRERLRNLGIDPEPWLDEMIAFGNQLIEGFEEVTFGLHLYRGNHRSMWAVVGGYDPIAERLFNELYHDRLLLEYDSPRAGSFKPLHLIPPKRVVVLGLLISTKEERVETPGEILPPIEEASQFISLDPLALSPQCGLASTLPGNLLG